MASNRNDGTTLRGCLGISGNLSLRVPGPSPGDGLVFLKLHVNLIPGNGTETDIQDKRGASGRKRNRKRRIGQGPLQPAPKKEAGEIVGGRIPRHITRKGHTGIVRRRSDMTGSSHQRKSNAECFGSVHRQFHCVGAGNLPEPVIAIYPHRGA